jgi:solute:Na+ symporter, SSS family
MNVAQCISSVLIASLMYGIFNTMALKKRQTTVYFKKSISFISIVFGLIALELGGSMMLGTCQEAYSSGICGLLYVVGISIGFLLLGLGFAAKMKAMNVESTIDLFEIKYKSPIIRMCASVLSIITVWGLLLGQIIATKSLIHALGVNNDIIFIIISLFIVLYAVIGGLSTAGIIYQVQLIYTIIVFGGIFGFCLVKEPPSFIQNVFLDRSLFTQSSLSFSLIFESLVMPALYFITDQEFAKPLFNITSRTISAASAVGASLFMLIFSLVPIYFGIKAKALSMPICDGVSPLIPVLKILTNDCVVVLAVLGMAAALIAMIDYYLWSIGLSITAEMRLAFKITNANALFDKIMVILVGIVAIFATFCTTSSAIQILLYSYELYDCCLIVPLLMSYFQTDLKKGSAIGAIVTGFVSFIIFNIFPLPFSGQITSFGLSFLGFYIGGWIQIAIQKIQAFRQFGTDNINSAQKPPIST